MDVIPERKEGKRDNDTRSYTGLPYDDEESFRKTRIIKGAENAGNQIISLILKAAEDDVSPVLNVALDRHGPLLMSAFLAFGSQTVAEHSKYLVRIVTDIQEENIREIKEILEVGGKSVEVKHSQGNIRKFACSRTEAIETSHSLQNGQPEEIVYSNDPEFVGQISKVFEGLWAKGVWAKDRIAEIEKGTVPRETKIMEDMDEIVSRITKSCETSSKSLLFCTMQSSLQLSHEYLLYAYKSALANHKRGQQEDNCLSPVLDGLENYQRKKKSFRWITRIEDSSVIPAVKKLMDLGIEIKHLDNPLLPFQFGLKDSEELFATFESSNIENPGGRVVSSVLFSNEPAYVAHYERVFEDLWVKAISAKERIKEIEEGIAPRRTEVVRGFENIVRANLRLFSNAKHIFNEVCDSNTPSLSVRVDGYKNAYLDLKCRGVKVKVITEITIENLRSCKEILELGIVSELRHMDSIKGNFAMTEKEYAASSTIESSGAPELIYSNDMQIVAQNQYVFDTLWNKATPAELRIKQLEEGVEPEETKLINDLQEIHELSQRLIGQSKEEVLVVLVNEKVLERSSMVFQKLSATQRQRNLKVRILVPSCTPSKDEKEGGREHQQKCILEELFKNSEWRRVKEPMSITFLIFDKKSMILTQYSDTKADTAELAIFSHIYTTNRQTINALVSIFGAFWRESELREEADNIKEALRFSLSKEERVRKQAELLQDILTHDIRNYSQITKFSAQLLEEELDELERKQVGEKIKPLISGLVDSVDQTNALLERAKKLGRIVSEVNPVLHSVDLLQTIQVSSSIIKDLYPEKDIINEVKILKDTTTEENPAYVIADELLGEVFLNLFSNSVKYTENNKVKIETSMEIVKGAPASLDSGSLSYWKVTVADEGKGIPDDLKGGKLFSRYLDSAKGSGLGLSIVHALVDRYHGSILVADRIPNDYTKGTKIELWLPLSDKPE